MQKDITMRYNALAKATEKMAKLREKWLNAQETDPYYADAIECKLVDAKNSITDRFSKYFNIQVSEDFSIEWK